MWCARKRVGLWSVFGVCVGVWGVCVCVGACVCCVGVCVFVCVCEVLGLSLSLSLSLPTTYSTYSAYSAYWARKSANARRNATKNVHEVHAFCCHESFVEVGTMTNEGPFW